MGLEGIVSKRLGSIYRSGRSKDWINLKNSAGGEAGGGRGLRAGGPERRKRRLKGNAHETGGFRRRSDDRPRRS
jgi:hypothetical protein